LESARFVCKPTLDLPLLGVTYVYEGVTERRQFEDVRRLESVPEALSGMSALPNSGRSDTWETENLTGYNRPKSVIRIF